MENLIIGAGPSGISCALTLAKNGIKSTVLERDNSAGGLCRTFNFNGYLFDIGGHRFLSSVNEINRLWRDVMGEDLLSVKRLSRIYYRKRFFNYPLSFFNTFKNLGPKESLLCVLSYLKCKYSKPGDDATFEGWIINRFGERLYDIFFKTYTEKVWAIACRDISADWARERIEGLSLRVAIQKAITGMKGPAPKTLCEEFLYPRTGPGEFYGRLQRVAEGSGANFRFNKRVFSVGHNGKEITAIRARDTVTGEAEEIDTRHVFSSMPLPHLVKMLTPEAPRDIIVAANRLRFRSILTVNIVLDKEHVFPDQWIYVHSPEVKFGRIQNYKNWSPAMVPDFKKTSLGLEYFCTEGDRLWRMNDVELVNHAVKELERLGIVSRRYLINGFVVRRNDVYPVYSLDYGREVGKIREYLNGFSNLSCMGRAGLFRYDNSDKALLSGIYSARNFLAEKKPDENLLDAII